MRISTTTPTTPTSSIEGRTSKRRKRHGPERMHRGECAGTLPYYSIGIPEGGGETKRTARTESGTRNPGPSLDVELLVQEDVADGRE